MEERTSRLLCITETTPHMSNMSNDRNVHGAENGHYYPDYTTSSAAEQAISAGAPADADPSPVQSSFARHWTPGESRDMSAPRSSNVPGEGQLVQNRYISFPHAPPLHPHEDSDHDSQRHTSFVSAKRKSLGPPPPSDYQQLRPANAHPYRSHASPPSSHSEVAVEWPRPRMSIASLVSGASSATLSFCSPPLAPPRPAVSKGKAKVAMEVLPAQISLPETARYSLIIRQQPQAARCCGYGDRDRRTIDPPPILELKVEDDCTPRADLERALSDLRSIVVVASLYDELGRVERAYMTEGPSPLDSRAADRRLLGMTACSPHWGYDEMGKAGAFFIFSDLSVRTQGRYTIRFKIHDITAQRVPGGGPGDLRPPRTSPVRDVIFSNPFEVYTAKDFPGMQSSSPLARCLKAQGLSLSIKKGSDSRQRKGPAGYPSDNDDTELSDNASDDDATYHGRQRKPRRKKKQKRT